MEHYPANLFETAAHMGQDPYGPYPGHFQAHFPPQFPPFAGVPDMHACAQVPHPHFGGFPAGAGPAYPAQAPPFAIPYEPSGQGDTAPASHGEEGGDHGRGAKAEVVRPPRSPAEPPAVAEESDRPPAVEAAFHHLRRYATMAAQISASCKAAKACAKAVEAAERRAEEAERRAEEAEAKALRESSRRQEIEEQKNLAIEQLRASESMRVTDAKARKSACARAMRVEKKAREAEERARAAEKEAAASKAQAEEAERRAHEAGRKAAAAATSSHQAEAAKKKNETNHQIHQRFRERANARVAQAEKARDRALSAQGKAEAAQAMAEASLKAAKEIEAVSPALRRYVVRHGAFRIGRLDGVIVGDDSEAAPGVVVDASTKADFTMVTVMTAGPTPEGPQTLHFGSRSLLRCLPSLDEPSVVTYAAVRSLVVTGTVKDAAIQRSTRHADAARRRSEEMHDAVVNLSRAVMASPTIRHGSGEKGDHVRRVETRKRRLENRARACRLAGPSAQVRLRETDFVDMAVVMGHTEEHATALWSEHVEQGGGLRAIAESGEIGSPGDLLAFACELWCGLGGKVRQLEEEHARRGLAAIVDGAKERATLELAMLLHVVRRFAQADRGQGEAARMRHARYADMRRAAGCDRPSDARSGLVAASIAGLDTTDLTALTGSSEEIASSSAAMLAAARVVASCRLTGTRTERRVSQAVERQPSCPSPPGLEELADELGPEGVLAALRTVTADHIDGKGGAPRVAAATLLTVVDATRRRRFYALGAAAAARVETSEESFSGIALPSGGDEHAIRYEFEMLRHTCPHVADAFRREAEWHAGPRSRLSLALHASERHAEARRAHLCAVAREMAARVSDGLLPLGFAVAAMRRCQRRAHDAACRARRVADAVGGDGGAGRALEMAERHFGLAPTYVGAFIKAAQGTDLDLSHRVLGWHAQ